MAKPQKMAFFAVTALLFLALQMSLLKTFPLTDEAQFLTMARLINSGKVPYRDFSDLHTPGLTYLTAFVFRGFGESYDVARGMMVFVSIATAFLLYFIGKRLFGEKAGMAAYLVFGIYAPVLHNFLLFALSFIAILTLLSASLFLDYFETGKNTRLFLAGTILGIAWLFKQNAVLSLLGFLLALLVFRRFGERKRLIPDCAVFLAGWALPIVIYLAYLLSQGALPDFVDDVFKVDYSRYAINTIPAFPPLATKIQAVSAISYAFIFIFALKIFMDRKKFDPAYILIISWGVLSLLYAWPNFSYPSFLPVLIPGALCAGWFFSQQDWRKWAIVAAVAILVVSAYFYAHRTFRDEFSGNNEFGNYDFYEIPDYIREHTAPNDTIYAFSGTVNYFMTGRNPASKHWYLRFFELDLEKRQARIIRDLERNRPKYVAYIPDQFLAMERVSDFAPIVNGYILKNYKTEKEFQAPWGVVWLMVPRSE